jgi:hypothetical protein
VKKTSWKNLGAVSTKGATLCAALAMAGTLVMREPIAAERVWPFPKNNTLSVARASLNAPIDIPVETKSAKPARKPTRCPQNLVARAEKTPAKKSPSYKVSLDRQWIGRRSHTNRTVRTREWLAHNQFVDSELNSDFPFDSTITDGWLPETDALRTAFEEAPLEETDYTEKRTAPVQVDVELALGVTFPDELPYREVVGTYQKDDFSQIRASFDELKDPEFTVWKSPRESEPVLVAPKARKAVPKFARVAAQPKARGKVAPAQGWTAKPSLSFNYVPPAVLDATAELSSIQKPSVGLQASPSEAAPELAVPTTPKVSSAAPVNVGPSLATLAAPVSTTPRANTSDITSAVPKPRVSTDAMATQSKAVSRSAVSLVEAADAAFDQTPFESDLYGRVTFSSEFSAWLSAQKGHVELYLQPVGSRDPQGTRYLSYRYPQSDFRDKAASLKGRYRLVAGIYRVQDVDGPYAEAVYQEEVNARTARGHLRFHIESRDLKVTSQASSSDRRHATVHLSFFEGASADYREPHEIADAEVRVIGYEKEYGILHADASGNLAIAAVPTHSDLAIEVRAKDYYRTFRTIHVFGSDAHLPVYMVSKDKVAAMTRALVGVRQGQSAALIMGRVFDPESRNPLEHERIELTDHPSQNGSYFSFFGEPGRTSSTGFYSFFNVAPAFRYVTRPDVDKRALRLYMRESSAYYVELGRGGMRSFHGRLTDPNLNGTTGNVAGAKIRLVGDDSFETRTGPDGRFEIPGIDFPSGMLAIDIEAPPQGPAYSLTRHTVAWNPRQAASVQDLFVVQDRFVSHSLNSAYSSDFGPNPVSIERSTASGNLIGGAYGALFDQAPNCLGVQLWSVDTGLPVAEGHGPYPFIAGTGGSGPLCLTRSAPGFTFQNLPPGEYLMKWTSENGHSIGSRIVHIGMGRDSISVN